MDRSDGLYGERHREGLLSRLHLSRARTLIYIVAISAITGLQITRPNKRVIETIVGLVLVLTLWTFSSINTLVFITVMYPFPFVIKIGNSNFIFVIIIFLIYMIRVSAKMERFRSDRDFNVPLILMILTYLLSFYALETSAKAYAAASHETANVIAGILLFYLVINFVDSEEKLRRLANMLLISATLVIIFTIIENFFPGRTIIPYWLYTRHKTRLVMRELRMGGPFHDFELTAEFFALNAPLIFFLIVREKRLATRVFYTCLFILNLVMMFTTITRGAFITLIFGYSYMMLIFRKDLNFVKFVAITSTIVVLLLIIDVFVTRYTMTGSLLARLLSTTFERGVIPETRFGAWKSSIERIMRSPIIGHGPFWDVEKKGTDFLLFPHNLYLYILSTVGALGLGAFIFFMVRLVKSSMASLGASISRSSFSESFLKVLHVILIMFLFDQIKIEYLRNVTYLYFVWLFFGLIAATKNIVEAKKKEPEKPAPSLESRGIAPRPT